MKLMIVFSVSSMLLIGCTQRKDADSIIDYWYNTILFSVQDISGNDLVKGIEFDWWQSDLEPDEEFAVGGGVKSELYSLDIVFPDPSMDPFEQYKAMNSSPDIILDDFIPKRLLLKKINGYSYLGVQPTSIRHNFLDWKVCYPPAGMLTFKLRCPYVFGDNAEHEIVTYWKPYTQILNDCYRVEFDGKEYALHDYSERPDCGKTGVLFIVVLNSN